MSSVQPPTPNLPVINEYNPKYWELRQFVGLYIFV